MPHLDDGGHRKRVTIYVTESDLWRGRSLFMVILEALRDQGCDGATVRRGIAGFGGSRRIHTATILRLSEQLPVVIEWIDSEERVEKVLPRIRSMVETGLITIEDVQVASHPH